MAVRGGVATIRPETGRGGGERGKLEGSRMGSTSRPSPYPFPSFYSDEDEEVMDDDDEVPRSRRTSRIRNQVDEEVEDFEEEDDDLEEEEEDEEEEEEEEELEEEDDEDLEEEEEEFQEEEEGNEDLGSDNVHEHEQASAVAAAPAPADVRVRTRTAVTNVTVCDADALECGVCFLTLSPPIFQCEVGHVVCSPCRDKLKATGNGKCHVCRVATRGYRRCHAMEHLLNCIRVPCPYAAHGCDATPPYHGQDSHRKVCLHAPCRCPGASCGFVGSTAALLDHFAGGAHNWPCTTKVRASEAFSIRLHIGFNFILVTNQHRRDDGDQAATGCQLFLLNVMQERLGRAISVLCIHPHATTNGALSTQCELVFSRFCDKNYKNSYHRYYQSSLFEVVFTDLSNGLPNPEGCFQFFVHNAALGDGDDKNSIQVKACIIN